MSDFLLNKYCSMCFFGEWRCAVYDKMDKGYCKWNVWEQGIKFDIMVPEEHANTKNTR